MRVLLVRPHINKKITTVKKFMFGEPMDIECVSTILKEIGHEVLLVDLLVESKRNFKKYLKKFNPDVVLGIGGYVTLPVLSAAHSLNIKTFIHEQNSIPGLSNKLLTKSTTIRRTRQAFKKSFS